MPTVLHSLVHPVLALSTPLVLRTKFLIDSELSPATFSVAKFCSSVTALLIKLPLETVLRRGQAAVLSQPSYSQAADGAASPPTSSNLGRQAGGAKTATSMPLEAIVHPGRYQGVLGTMYTIIVRTRNWGADLRAGVRSAVGGEIQFPQINVYTPRGSYGAVGRGVYEPRRECHYCG